MKKTGEISFSDTFDTEKRRKEGEGMYLVSTIAGGENGGHLDGRGEEALFYRPRGICVDSKKNLYIADGGNHCIRHVSPDGQVSTLAGKPGRETEKRKYTLIYKKRKLEHHIH